MTDTTDINLDYLTPISEQSDRSVSPHYNGYTRAHSPFANGYAKGKRIRGHLVNGDAKGDIPVSRENLANGDDKRSMPRHQLINDHTRNKSLPVHSANGGLRSEPSNSTPSKNRCYLIALASVIVTIVLAGATFAVVYFLEIKSSKPPVDIEEPDCTFNIGEPGNLTFEMANLTDWTGLYISREFTVPVASANRTSRNVEIAQTHGHISALNTTELSNHSVRIDLLFDPVSCNDSAGKSGIVKYVCSIKMTDSSWINVTKRIRFQRLPGVPKLTMSKEVINNKVTRADLPYVCEGELGDPRGRLIIESDFNGEFQALFTEDNTSNSIGFIFHEKLTTEYCGNYQTLQFAFYKPNMSMNFKRLRCSIKPSSNNSVVKSSDEGIIKVVPDDWCKAATKQTPIIDHPYACHLGVMCSEVGIVLGVPASCSEDQCYSALNMAYGCYPCKCAKGGPLPSATTTSVPNGK